MLYNRLKLWETDGDILSESQAGFRAGYSTVDHIFTLNSLVTKAFIEKKHLYCAFIDIKKAFNSIFRQGLWYKMNLLGLNCKLLRIVSHMYTKIKCCVRGRDGLTDYFLTLLGVQQGAILSPYLFAFYLNQKPELLYARNAKGGIFISEQEREIMLLMYADDMVCVSESVEGLQDSLDLLYDYCNTWKLTVNMKKSSVLTCKPGGRTRMDEVWFWGEQILDTCTEYKYLGITFTCGGITNTCLNVLNDQAKKSLCSLLSGMRSIGVFPPAAALRVFHTSITPILHYSCEVWGYLPGDNLQITLNRFCTNILGVKLSSSNAAVAGELGQYPLIIDRKVRMLKY